MPFFIILAQQSTLYLFPIWESLIWWLEPTGFGYLSAGAFIAWLVQTILILVVCFLVGYPLSISTDLRSLIEQAKLTKASSFWLNARFYLALAVAISLVSHSAQSCFVLHIMDFKVLTMEWSPSGLPFWMVVELVLFLLCCYALKQLKEENLPLHVVVQAVFLVVGNAALTGLALGLDIQFSVALSLAMNILFALASLVVVESCFALGWSSSSAIMTSLIGRYGPWIKEQDPTRLQKLSLTYLGSFYLFLAGTKLLICLELYSSPGGSNPFGSYRWLWMVVWLGLAIYFLRIAVCYATLWASTYLVIKKPVPFGHSLILCLPYEPWILIQRFFPPLLYILRLTWHLHGQSSEVDPTAKVAFVRFGFLLLRLLKTLLNPAYSVCVDSSLEQVFGLHVMGGGAGNKITLVASMVSGLAGVMGLGQLVSDGLSSSSISHDTRILVDATPKIEELGRIAPQNPALQESVQSYKQHAGLAQMAIAKGQPSLEHLSYTALDLRKVVEQIDICKQPSTNNMQIKEYLNCIDKYLKDRK